MGHSSTNYKTFTLLTCFMLFKINGASGNDDVELNVFTDVRFDKQYVTLGEQTVFRCLISFDIYLSEYDFFVEWPYGIWSTKFGQQLSNIYDIQNSTHREIGKIIYQADYKDDGLYSCRATTVDSPIQTETKEKNLTILSTTKAVTLSPTGTHVTLKEGESVEITCLAELANPAAQITWTVGTGTDTTNLSATANLPGSSSSSSHFGIAPSVITRSGEKSDPRKSTESIIEVTGSKSLHNEELSCRAKSLADDDYVTSSTRLNVLYSPEVTVKVDPELIHPLDEEVEIQCIADANPVPTQYIWYLEGQELSSVQQSLISLKVSQLMGKQTISCRATNRINGRDYYDEGSALLHFAKPPVFITRPQDKNVKEGDPFDLVCHAEGEPTPKLEWTRGNSGDVIHVGGTYSVSSAKKNHQGDYTCIATSQGFPPISASAKIQIFGAPVIFMESKVYGAVGDSLSLECTVDASVVAPSYVVWEANGVTLPEGEFQKYFVEKSEHDNFVSLLLTISKVTESDFGQYNCTAYNEAGITTKVLFLKENDENKVPELLIIILVSGAVAAVLLLLILIIVCVCCCRIRKRKRGLRMTKMTSYAPDAKAQAPPLSVEVKPNHRVMNPNGMSNISLDSSATTPYNSQNSRQASLDRAMLMGNNPGNIYPLQHQSYVPTSGPFVHSQAGATGTMLSPDHDPYNEDYYKLKLQSQHMTGSATDGTPQFVHVMNHRNSLPISTSPLNLNSSQQIFLDPESQSVQYSSIKPYVPSHHVIPSDQIDMPIMLLGAGKPPNRASPIQFFPRSNTIECFGDGNYSSIGLGSDRSYNSDDLRNKFRAHIPLEIDSGLGSSVQESPPIATTTLLQLANQQEQRALNPLIECSVNQTPSSASNVLSTITPIRRPLKPPPYDSNQNSPAVTSSLSRQAKTVSVGSMDHISRSMSVNQDIGGVSGMVRGDKKQSVSTFKPQNTIGASNRSLNRVDEIFDPTTDNLPGVLRSEFQSDIRSPNEACLMSPTRLLQMQQDAKRQQDAFNRAEAQQMLIDSQAQSKRPPRSAIAQQRPLQVPAVVVRGRQSSDSSEFSESTVRQPNEKPPLAGSMGNPVRRKPSVKNKVRFCDEDTTSYPTDADVEDSDFSDISSSYAHQATSNISAPERSMLEQQRKNNILNTDISNSPNKSFHLV